MGGVKTEPLDESLIFLLPQHFFHEIYVLELGFLQFLSVESTLYEIAFQILKNVGDWSSMVDALNLENFSCPIRCITFIEESLMLAQPHEITSFEFHFARLRSTLFEESPNDPLLIFICDFCRFHPCRSVHAVIVPVQQRLQ